MLWGNSNASKSLPDFIGLPLQYPRRDLIMRHDRVLTEALTIHSGRSLCRRMTLIPSVGWFMAKSSLSNMD